MSPFSLLAITRGFYQLLVLLIELSPLMIKLWKQWQKRNGRLTRSERLRLSNAVRKSVTQKNTEDLEKFLTKNQTSKMEVEP